MGRRRFVEPDYSSVIGLVQNGLYDEWAKRPIDCDSNADVYAVYRVARTHGLIPAHNSSLDSVFMLIGLFMVVIDAGLVGYYGYVGAPLWFLLVLNAVFSAVTLASLFALHWLFDADNVPDQTEPIKRAITAWVDGGYRASKWFKNMSSDNQARYDALYARAQASKRDDNAADGTGASNEHDNPVVDKVEALATTAFAG